MPMQLLTAEEKISELQQVVDAKGHENNELKARADRNQSSGSKQSKESKYQ